MPHGYATASSPVSGEDAGWWHRVELPGGYVAPRIDPPATELADLRLPDLTGKTVLDVGALDGRCSFAAERLGASRVVALGGHAWRRPGGRDNFEHAKQVLLSRVEDMDMEVLDISPETVGEFDVVLFLGVLQHMRHPLLALERVAGVTRERLVVETLVDMTFVRTPAAAFYPWSMLGDETNWWAPNRAAVVAMLRDLGFDRATVFPVKRLSSGRVRKLASRAKAGIDVLAMMPTAARPRLRRDLVRHLLTQSRLVVHGWREPGR
jgi:tRNA (mo5U34)-methyltransferase